MSRRVTLFPVATRFAESIQKQRFVAAPKIVNWKIPRATESGIQISTESGIGITTESGDAIVTE